MFLQHRFVKPMYQFAIDMGNLVIGKPKTFTTEGTKEHRGNLVIGKGKGLPRISTDKRGSEKIRSSITDQQR